MPGTRTPIEPTPSPAEWPMSPPLAGSPLWRRAVLFPDVYAWFVLFSVLDLVLTWVILHLEGAELNAVADWVIRRYDLVGVTIYKFALVLLVVLVCEIVGRRRPQTGLRLARWAVVLSTFPVVVAVVHLIGALVAPPE